MLACPFLSCFDFCILREISSYMENQPTKSPKWLKRLERESWQAELVISGLAIFGSMQLPPYILETGKWALNYFIEPGILLYFAISYLYVASIFLVASFIIHFILRTVWIGLIGLNSVFPEGINRKYMKNYSRFFIERLLKKYPANNLWIEQLDKICSSIFAFFTYFTLVFIVFSFNLFILIGIKTILSPILPEYVMVAIGWVLLGIFILFLLLSMFLNLKRNHENERYQCYYFKLYIGFSKFILHIFHQPINYISFIFLSYVDIKKYIGGVLLFSIPLMMFATNQLGKSEAIYLFDTERFHNQFDRTDRTFTYHYEEDLMGESKTIFTPFIESKLIKGKQMKLFVPIHNNENNVIENLCGVWKDKDELSRMENRKLSHQFFTACYEKYHKVYLNDSLYQIDFVKYEHPIGQTDGILTYLPTNNLKAGKNTLKVEKMYDSTNVFRTVNIPFWFE